MSLDNDVLTELVGSAVRKELMGGAPITPRNVFAKLTGRKPTGTKAKTAAVTAAATVAAQTVQGIPDELTLPLAIIGVIMMICHTITDIAAMKYGCQNVALEEGEGE